jgi:hypothetical protein
MESREFNLPDPPLVIWINPSKQYTVLKSNKASIKATIKSNSGLNSVQLFLNDVLYGEPDMSPSTTERGTFIITKTIVFEPGDNCVYLVVTNNEGSSRSEKRFFTVSALDSNDDSTAIPSSGSPLIMWTDPLKVKTTLSSSKANVKATVRSGSGISSVVLYLNGVLYGEPEMTPSPTEKGSFLIQKTINFEPGEDTIYLVASSNRGTTTSDKRYFSVPSAFKNYDAKVLAPAGPPVISWTDPYRSRTTVNSTRTDIKATIKSNSGINSVILYLNNVLYGEPEMVPSSTEAGSFTISKTVNLELGQDSIYFIATSATGTTTSEKRYFNVPLSAKVVDSAAINLVPAPSITWAAPSVKSTTLRSASANLRATIKSISDLTSVVIYLNGISQGETETKPSQTEAQSFVLEKTLNFRQVENNIYIVARNTGGGITRSESRIFICPPSSLAANQLANQNVPKTGDTGLANKPAATRQTETAQVVPAPQVSAQVVAAPAAPVISWTSPSGSHTILESFNATVKANIKSGSGLKSVLLYLNGISRGTAEIKQTEGESGNYTVEKNINFGPGENTIYLVVTNNEGATKSEVRYFSNPETVAPVITWTNPESPNSLVNQESLTVSACIKSSTELRSVKLLVNGNIQIEDNVFQASATGDCNYNWNTSVVLREGDNSIFIIAANAAGSITSEKRVIKMTTVLAEKRLALIVGNSQYKNSAPLKNPVNDANLMEATLKDLGFQVIKRLDAGYDEMKSAIREFENKLPDYNIALFYYAGHGNQVDGKNYLIPTDAKLEKPGDCKFEAIEVNLIVDEFERYQDNTNIVILDACRNNPFAAWARGGEAGFRPMNFTSGTIVAYATSMGATAADGKGANGLYTEELVKQMAVPQPISSVFMNTRVQVRKLSNNQQVPSEENKLNGEFYFRK